MLPPSENCRSCRQRDHDIQLLQSKIEQLEKDNARLQRRCARLKKDQQRLRRELDKAQRQAHRQAARFRRKHLKKNHAKPGRPKGHAADLRPTPTPEQVDRVVNVACAVCPDCNVALVDPSVVVQYQTDLPPIVPIITQFQIETGFCPCCRQRVQGRHPEQISNAIGAAGNTLGPVVLTMGAEMKHRLGVPYRKICDFLETYTDLKVCPATFVRAEQRLANLARPTYDLLIDALRRCGVVHADETGWRVGSVSGWLWVFTSKDITIYTIRTGPGARGHEIPAEILGPDFDGYLIIDGGKAYECLEYAKGQCNAHVLRRAKDMQENASASEQDILQTLITLIQEAIALSQIEEPQAMPEYARQVKQMEFRLEEWLGGIACRRNSPELDRLAKHVAKHWDEWLLFLREPTVPPTNNHAERMLRPAVITRKVGGCNKTLLGALVHSMLASIMVTCKQQGHKFLDLARKLWSAGEPQAIPLIPPADQPNEATTAMAT